MIFQVDKEGENAIYQLCDIALKAGGINNLSQINIVLKSIKLISEKEAKRILKKDKVKNANKNIHS